MQGGAQTGERRPRIAGAPRGRMAAPGLAGQPPRHAGGSGDASGNEAAVGVALVKSWIASGMKYFYSKKSKPTNECSGSGQKTAMPLRGPTQRAAGGRGEAEPGAAPGPRGPLPSSAAGGLAETPRRSDREKQLQPVEAAARRRVPARTGAASRCRSARPKSRGSTSAGQGVRLLTFAFACEETGLPVRKSGAGRLGPRAGAWRGHSALVRVETEVAFKDRLRMTTREA